MFIHDKNNLEKQIVKFILCLIPLYLYGFYKNGILLFQKDFISFFSMFKIFYLLLINILIYTIIHLILKKKIHFNYHFLSIFIIPLFMPYNINYIIYFIIITIMYFIIIKKPKISINYVDLTIMIIYLINKDSFLNPAEINKIYSFNYFDILWGRGVGSIGTSSIIISFIIFAILSFIIYYKYIIVISSFLGIILFSIIFNDFSILLNSVLISSLLFILPWSSKSPIEIKWQIIYGFLAGVLAFFLTKYLNFYYGGLISIVFCNILYEIVCKLTKKVL